MLQPIVYVRPICVKMPGFGRFGPSKIVISIYMIFMLERNFLEIMNQRILGCIILIGRFPVYSETARPNHDTCIQAGRSRAHLYVSSLPGITQMCRQLVHPRARATARAKLRPRVARMNERRNACHWRKNVQVEGVAGRKRAPEDDMSMEFERGQHRFVRCPLRCVLVKPLPLAAWALCPAWSTWSPKDTSSRATHYVHRGTSHSMTVNVNNARFPRKATAQPGGTHGTWFTKNPLIPAEKHNPERRTKLNNCFV